MCPAGYYAMICSKNHKFDLRIHLVRYALKHGIRPAERQYKCSRNTVRKWLRRYEAEGLKGLEERSRAPRRIPHKTPPEEEQKVIRQRLRTKGFSAERLKREFELTPGIGAIKRIIRQNGLTRKRKKKHQTKRDLRAVKSKYKPFRQLQMDVKYLNDIPNYFPYYLQPGYPRFQYTIRCVKTGATFLTYGSELSVTYAELTARRLLKNLEDFGLDPSEVTIQTDRGSEFDGQVVNEKKAGFTHTIEKEFNAHHRLLLKANPNANADVESFHAHEETEFFDVESFQSPQDFWEKIITYQHYWNMGRENSYKGNKTPLEIMRESDPELDPRIFLLPPVNLDNLMGLRIEGGHHVPYLTDKGWNISDL
jgi:transposase